MEAPGIWDTSSFSSDWRAVGATHKPKGITRGEYALDNAIKAAICWALSVKVIWNKNLSKSNLEIYLAGPIDLMQSSNRCESNNYLASCSVHKHVMIHLASKLRLQGSTRAITFFIWDQTQAWLLTSGAGWHSVLGSLHLEFVWLYLRLGRQYRRQPVE